MGQLDLDLVLPPPTSDLDEAAAHLDEHGVARIPDALTAAEVEGLLDRLVEQAEAERRGRIAFFDGGGGANQRVWNLPSKGAPFIDLLRLPIVRRLTRHVLGGEVLL